MKDSVIKNDEGSISFDYQAMKDNIAEADKEQAQAFNDRMQRMADRAQEEQDETTALYAKALRSEHDEHEAARAEAMEKERIASMQAVEDKYAADGVKTTHDKVMDNAYKNLLGHTIPMDEEIKEESFTSNLDKAYAKSTKDLFGTID